MATDNKHAKVTASVSNDNEDNENKENSYEKESLSELFYNPYISACVVSLIVFLVYSSLTRDDTDFDSNIKYGVLFAIVFYMVICGVICPNGPFNRPHPAVWKIIFGLSVLYLFLVIVLLFQSFKNVRLFISWLYADLQFTGPDEKEYAVNCSDISAYRLWESLDFFVFAHFWGWALKALLIRHYGICWTISIMWEFSEMAFAHLLPNFNECWWDAIVLDVLLCNGLGIWFGMYVCRKMEMVNHHWESISNIRSTTGKIKRAVLQFTPATWAHGRWLIPNTSLMRIFSVSIFIMIWNVAELNTFFLKHIFYVPSSHPLNWIRTLFLGVVSAPSIRQYYSYVTDGECLNLGSQFCMFFLITFVESIVCIKFGAEMFININLYNVVKWIIWQIVMSILCLYISVWLAQKWKTIEEVIETEIHGVWQRSRFRRRARSLSDTRSERTNGYLQNDYPDFTSFGSKSLAAATCFCQSCSTVLSEKIS